VSNQPISSDSYTHRDVLNLATPMILSSLSIPLLGVVDTAVMGHLDSAHYLAAVAVGAVLFNFIYMGMNFLRMGTTGLIAQAYGKNDHTEVRSVFMQAILVAIGLAATLLLIQKPLSLTLHWLQASSIVTDTAIKYFHWRIWSAPAVLANFVLIGWFLGMQSGRGPMLMLFTTNIINIILDIIFVTQLGMDVDGVALASVIAEFCGLAAGLVYWRVLLKRHPGNWDKQQIFDLSKLKRFFTVNSHILIRTFSLMCAFAFFTAQGAKFGDSILAANAILINFQSILAYGLDGFAHAAEALVGRATGEKNKAGLKKAIRIAFQWSFGIALGFTVVFLIFGKGIIGLLTDIEEIRNLAENYLFWLIISPIVSVWCFVYDGIFIGATKTKEMMLNMLASTFLVFIPSVFILRTFGNHGLWAAFMLFLLARALFLHKDRKKLFEF